MITETTAERSNLIRMKTNSLEALVKQARIFSKLKAATSTDTGISDPRIERYQNELSQLGATKIPKVH